MKYRLAQGVSDTFPEETLLALKVYDRLDDDASVVAAARTGDAAAREALVRRWTEPVYRFAYRMLLNEGQLDGVRILKPETVRLARGNLLPPGVTMGLIPGKANGFGALMQVVIPGGDFPGTEPPG